MKKTDYEITGSDPLALPGYNGYRLYLARDITHSTPEKTHSLYLLTRERLNGGERVAAETGAELLPVDAGRAADILNNLKIMVYRPSDCREKYLTVREEIIGDHARTYGESMAGYRLFMAEWQCLRGYETSLEKIFSHAALNPAESIPAAELTTRYGNPRYGSRQPYYIHDKQKTLRVFGA